MEYERTEDGKNDDNSERCSENDVDEYDDDWLTEGEGEDEDPDWAGMEQDVETNHEADDEDNHYTSKNDIT